MNFKGNIGLVDRIIRIVVFIIALYLGYRISSWFYSYLGLIPLCLQRHDSQVGMTENPSRRFV